MVDASIRVNSLAKVYCNSSPAGAVSLAILPDAAKFVFRGRPSSFSSVAEIFGVELPQGANRFNKKDKRKAYWLGPDEWLLEAIEENPTELFSAMSHRLASHSYSLVDVSHRSDALEIKGAKSPYVLNHGCPLDLSEQQFPVGMCTRTAFGKSPVLLSRTERVTFCIDVWRSFSTYTWLLLDEARQELALDPVRSDENI
jgi:sarcosine oxidase subunit gamma